MVKQKSGIGYMLRAPGGRTFVVVWAGQLVSNVGSSMTAFALGLWVFGETGSATQLATIILASRLPMLVMSPFAGALVDRWNRRRAMIISDTGAAVGTLATALLLATGTLEIWHLYVTLAFSGIFQTFQFPAYSAATTMLVAKEHYGRASGLVQLAGSVGNVAAPTLAAVLVVTGGLTAVFVIDFVTFLVAVGTLAAVRIREPQRTATPGRGVGALLRESKQGFAFVGARRGLLVLLLSFTVVNFAFSFQSVLLIPLLLSMTTEATAGVVVSIGALGLVGGSLALSVWGGPSDRIKGLYGALVFMAVGLAIMGAAPSIAAVIVGTVLMHATHPIAGGSSQAIWQSKVPPEMQGRVFAVRQVMAIAAAPIAFILAGRLADGFFEPLMREGGGLAESVGTIIGVGAGRGVGLMFILIGVLVGLTVAVAWRHPRIRNLEQEVPDLGAEPVLVGAQTR